MDSQLANPAIQLSAQGTHARRQDSEEDPLPSHPLPSLRTAVANCYSRADLSLAPNPLNRPRRRRLDCSIYAPRADAHRQCLCMDRAHAQRCTHGPGLRPACLLHNQLSIHRPYLHTARSPQPATVLTLTLSFSSKCVVN